MISFIFRNRAHHLNVNIFTAVFSCSTWLHHVTKTFHTRSIGWALFGVNFRPLEKIEQIIGGGQIFDTGAFFARLQYMQYLSLSRTTYQHIH